MGEQGPMHPGLRGRLCEAALLLWEALWLHAGMGMGMGMGACPQPCTCVGALWPGMLQQGLSKAWGAWGGVPQSPEQRACTDRAMGRWLGTQPGCHRHFCIRFVACGWHCIGLLLMVIHEGAFLDRARLGHCFLLYLWAAESPSPTSKMGLFLTLLKASPTAKLVLLYTNTLWPTGKKKVPSLRIKMLFHPRQRGCWFQSLSLQMITYFILSIHRNKGWSPISAPSLVWGRWRFSMLRHAASRGDGGAQPGGKVSAQLPGAGDGIKTGPVQPGCPLKDSSVRWKGKGIGIAAHVVESTRPSIDAWGLPEMNVQTVALRWLVWNVKRSAKLVCKTN